jgi:hypothetical protein
MKFSHQSYHKTIKTDRNELSEFNIQCTCSGHTVRCKHLNEEYQPPSFTMAICRATCSGVSPGVKVNTSGLAPYLINIEIVPQSAPLTAATSGRTLLADRYVTDAPASSIFSKALWRRFKDDLQNTCIVHCCMTRRFSAAQ